MPIARLSLLAFALFLLFPAAALAAKPQELIVGKWQTQDNEGGSEINIIVEYLKDGGLKARFEFPKSGSKIEVLGRYRFVDDNTLETEVNFQGELRREKAAISVTKEALVETDAQGKKREYKRVK
jgi:uncharacterized protein (TIGR03066 family)